MEFKTKEANDAYRELLNNLSERCIRLYGDLKRMRKISEADRFLLNMGIEKFQQEGLCSAITTASQVDSNGLALRGHLGLVATQLNRE